MQTENDLLQDLPANLDEALRAKILPDEKLTGTLSGSYGEALAVTDRRVLIVREDLPAGTQAGGIQVYAYVLGQITDTVIDSSGVAGSLTLLTDKPPGDPDHVTICFPSYDQPKFEAAAAMIRELASSRAAPVSAGVAAAGSASGVALASCPACGEPVRDYYTFCGRCGVPLAAECAGCGGPLKAADQFCTRCGREREEALVQCTECGKRIYHSDYFCSDCGRVLRARCASCGSTVLAQWRYCSACGREIGAEARSPLSALSRSVVRGEDDRSRPRTEAASGTVKEEESNPVSAAALHNKAAEQLFEQDRVDEAIEKFRQAVQADPSNPTYHCNLAVAYDEKDMNDLALSEYRKALDLDPTDVRALLYLGYLYSERNEPEKAAAMWRKVTQVSPGSAEAVEAEDCLRHQGGL